MKFAHKLMLVIIVFLTVSLAVAGYFSVTQNFNAAFENIVSQNTTLHLFERYSVETQLIEIIQSASDDKEAALRSFADTQANYIGSQNRWQALYNETGSAIYSSVSLEIRDQILAAIETGNEHGYVVLTSESTKYMVFISSIEDNNTTLFLVSAYDITHLYTERQRQIQATLRIDAIILVLASVAIIASSIRLTNSIRTLNRTSKKIARGAYDARAQIATDDEIGELGENFNRMAAAVQAKVDELNLSVRQREDFVSAFTHEVKTPMTAIIGYSDMLRFKERTPEVRQKAAQFIYREANRLETLSQKLLLLMGLSDGAAELLPIPLETLFRDAARSVFPVLQESGIEVKMTPTEDIAVLADKDLLVDLLRNLLLNAIKAGPKDNTVWLRAKQKDNRVLVAVVDSGKGIPAEELARITEPFYMVDKSRARREGSSGVGLALCRRIAELHGGTLDFQSEADKGTVVSFVLSVPAVQANTQ